MLVVEGLSEAIGTRHVDTFTTIHRFGGFEPRKVEHGRTRDWVSFLTRYHWRLVILDGMVRLEAAKLSRDDGKPGEYKEEWAISRDSIRAVQLGSATECPKQFFRFRADFDSPYLRTFYWGDPPPEKDSGGYPDLTLDKWFKRLSPNEPVMMESPLKSSDIYDHYFLIWLYLHSGELLFVSGGLTTEQRSPRVDLLKVRAAIVSAIEEDRRASSAAKANAANQGLYL